MSTATIFNDLTAVIQEIKSRVSLSDAIGKVADIKKPSSNMHKALCMFHEEKTPSFTISPDKGVYHCFGCHASGDLVTFYKDYYRLNTIEAVDRIAEEYDIDLERHRRPLTPEEQEERRLVAINNKLADLLHEQVDEADYFWEERSIDPSHENLKPYKLGYSANLSDVMTLARQAGASPADIETLDLNRANMWTDAIVYPYINSRGDVRGFKNRPLYGGNRIDGAPKFVGTLNTPVAQTDLYGLHVARKYAEKHLVIVEGQHDVLSMAQDGIRNVVSSDGTTLNFDKLDLLQDMGIKNVVLVFDGDNPGKQASKSVAQVLNEKREDLNMIVKIASVPDGTDPDEMIRNGQRISLLSSIMLAVYANQYLIDMIMADMQIQGADIQSVTGKMDFINTVKPVLLVASGIEQAFLMEYVAQKINSRSEFIEDLLRTEATAGKKSILFDVEGEKGVLSQMLRDENFRHEALVEMRAKYFYIIKHQHLFDIISQAVREDIPINITTIRTLINNRGLNDIFSNGFVEQLADISGNFRSTMQDLVDKALRRQIQKEANNLAVTAGDLATSTPLLVEAHLSNVQGIADNQSDNGLILQPQAGATQFMDRVLNNMRNPGSIEGVVIKSQPTLTKLLRGLCGNRLITISANQSVGKTTLLANILNDISVEDGIPWLHFSVEMSSEEVADKIIGLNAGVEGSKIADGIINDEEYRRVQNSALKYYNSKLYIDDEASTLEQIVNTTRRYLRNKQIAGISIDYIQLLTMENSKARQKYEELGDISGALKRDIAKKMNLPVIVLSQLNRGAVNAEVATAEDGAGSYKIAQDSDVYMTLKDKTDEAIEEQGGLQQAGNQVLFLDKNRHGKADVFIDVLFMRETQRMEEVRK